MSGGQLFLRGARPRMDAVLKPVSDGLFNPDDEYKFESLVPNPDDRFKAAFTDVELLPFAMPVK